MDKTQPVCELVKNSNPVRFELQRVPSFRPRSDGQTVNGKFLKKGPSGGVVDDCVILSQHQKQWLSKMFRLSLYYLIEISPGVQETAGDRMKCQRILCDKPLPFVDLSEQRGIVQRHWNMLPDDFHSASQSQSKSL